MRVIICDDDEYIRQRLHENIRLAFKSMRKSGYQGLLECDEYDNGKDLLEDEGEKDLVFLDIEMPGADGINVGRALKQADSDVLIAYVTSHTEFLDDAMSFCVFRYISKPLNQERIVKCISGFRLIKKSLIVPIIFITSPFFIYSFSLLESFSTITILYVLTLRYTKLPSSITTLILLLLLRQCFFLKNPGQKTGEASEKSWHCLQASYPDI